MGRLCVCMIEDRIFAPFAFVASLSSSTELAMMCLFFFIVTLTTCALPLHGLSLLQWAALGCIGALIDESVLQLSLFCGLHSISFFLLVFVKPLANR